MVLSFYNLELSLTSHGLIQFRLLYLMYCQSHQFNCIPLELSIVLGGTSYNTRAPAYSANIPMFSLIFPQRSFVLKLHNGGIYYHPL